MTQIIKVPGNLLELMDFSNYTSSNHRIPFTRSSSGNLKGQNNVFELEGYSN